MLLKCLFCDSLFVGWQSFSSEDNKKQRWSHHLCMNPPRSQKHTSSSREKLRISLSNCHKRKQAPTPCEHLDTHSKGVVHMTLPQGRWKFLFLPCSCPQKTSSAFLNLSTVFWKPEKKKKQIGNQKFVNPESFIRNVRIEKNTGVQMTTFLKFVFVYHI